MFSRSQKIFICALILFSAHSKKLLAQNQTQTTAQKSGDATPQKLPKVLILPWQTPLIDPDLLRQTKDARDVVSEKIRKTFAPNALALAKIAPKEKVPFALNDDIAEIFADESKVTEDAFAIFPIWTHFHDHEFVGLIKLDAFRNTINSVFHKLLPKRQFLEALKDKSLERVLTTEFESLLQAASSTSTPNTSQDLAVSVSDQTPSKRLNEIDRTTLNTLITYRSAQENGQPQVTILNPFASDLIVAIHRLFGVKSTLRRANRLLSIKIAYEKSPFALTLPTKLNMTVNATEAVFGKSLPTTWTEPLTVGITSDNTVELKYSAKLSDLFRVEKLALKREDLPTVVKIKGAWAYVDKGRAWGLQMNDRLMSTGAAPAVKGHVVGYFGPEMKLKSPRGYDIHEGAIIFIRSGQKVVKEGDVFSYDQKKVPSL
jgi:hypothetical protein